MKHWHSFLILLLQTGQNSPRECIKRWNVTTKRGIHTVYVFATIKVKRPILLFSFAVKSTAAGSKCLVFFFCPSMVKVPQAPGPPAPPVQQIQQAPPQAANLEVEMFSVFQTGVSFITWTVMLLWSNDG